MQYRDDFKAPPTNAGGSSYSKHKSRFGLVCKETMVEAAFAYGGGLPAGGFDMTLGGAAAEPTRDETVARFRSTAGDAMEFGTKLGRAASIREAAEMAALASTQLALPAGGKPSVVIDRGRKSVGISGEKLNLDGDARRNTMCVAARRAGCGGGGEVAREGGMPPASLNA